MSLPNKNNTKSPKVNVRKKKSNPLTLGLLILLYIAVLLFIGFSEFVSAGLDRSLVFTGAWWSKTLTAVAINNIILIGTIMYKLQKDTETKEEVVNERTRVNAASLAHIDPTTFDPWFADFNLERKIKKYKRALSNKLDKLNKKVSQEDLEEWVRYQKKVVQYEAKIKQNPDNIEIDEPVSENNYVNQRLILKVQMSDEFIQERIHYMRINYKPIKKSFVTNGYMGSRSTDDNYEVENGALKMLKDLGPKIIITLGYLAFINSLVIELISQPDYAVAIIAIVLKLIPILMQIYNAITYVNSYIRDKVMVDLRTRWEIIVKYVKEVKKKVVQRDEPKVGVTEKEVIT